MMALDKEISRALGREMDKEIWAGQTKKAPWGASLYNGDERLQSFFNGFDGGVDFKFCGHFGNNLGVGDNTGFVDDEHRTGEKAKLFNKNAVIQAERNIIVVRKGDNIMDVGGAAPSSLSKGQVARNG